MDDGGDDSASVVGEAVAVSESACVEVRRAPGGSRLDRAGVIELPFWNRNRGGIALCVDHR